MKQHWAVLVAAFALAATQLAQAQSSNHGAITGTVTDPSGGVIPGVRIEVQNLGTGVTRTVESNQQGHYRVEFLIPGQYMLKAELTGFKKIEMPDLTVRVSEALRVDFAMVIGTLSEAVTVTEGAALINTDTAALGHVVDNAKIQNLPLNGREFIALAALVPGAESGNPKRGTVYSKGYAVGFNGARSMYNSYYIDGADSTNANYHQLISSPSLDSVKEFRVETNMYSAQYGRSGGAVINIVTNSGTNAFHGSLYEYHRNKVLDARPVFDTRPRENQPGYLFNQFGGSVGGPIFKNRTFFFASTEFYRQKKPGGLMVTFAPTAKERVGDLSETINPLSLQPVVLTNPFTGQVIPDSRVPASLISPVGKQLMDLWPEPNYSGDPFLNLRMFRGASFNQDKFLVRGDHHFTPKDTLSGTFNFGDYDNGGVWHTIYGDTNAPEHDRTMVLTYTKILTPKLVNDLKFSHVWFLHGSDFLLKDKNYSKEWGIYTESESLGSPRLLFYTVGFQRFDIGNGGALLFDNKDIYLKDNLVWTLNTHTISLGGDFKRQRYNWLYESTGAGGGYYFGLYEGSPTQSLYNQYNATGSVFSSVLMATSSREDFSLQKNFNQLRRNMFGLFVQDDWKVSPRLTLNLGLRYDWEAPFSEATGQFATINEQTGLIRYAKGAPADKLALIRFPYETDGPNRPYDPSLTNFAPRFGFAFRPFDNNRTVIRGGYGLFYTSEIAFATVYGAWVAPFGGVITYRPKADFLSEPTDHFLTIDQKPYRLDEFKGNNPGFFLPNSEYYPTGYMQQWNLTVAHELARDLVLELSYVGSKGTNLNGGTSLGAYNPELLAKYNRNIAGNPGIRVKGNNSKYHSFQAKFSKNYSHGLSFLTAFTWGHGLAESSNDDTNENILTDVALTGVNFVDRRYSRADFDVRRRLVFSGGYELPFGRGKAWGNDWNGITDGVLGGWQVYSILTFSDGYPFTVYNSALRFPDRICDGKLPSGERSADRWFDFTCFPEHVPQTVTTPDGRTVSANLNGNSGPNVITGPGFNNLDLGIHKNFRVTEGTRVELRFESFNLFNHPNYVGPSATYFFNSSSGARLTRARDNRDIQLALKILF